MGVMTDAASWSVRPFISMAAEMGTVADWLILVFQAILISNLGGVPIPTALTAPAAFFGYPYVLQ